jgi:hypothetical protein
MEKTLYFAFLDENNVVVNVIAPEEYNEDLDTGEMVLYDPSETISLVSGAVSAQQYSQDDDSITKNPGVIGYTYDSTLNAFIPPKQDFISWSFLDTTTPGTIHWIWNWVSQLSDDDRNYLSEMKEKNIKAIEQSKEKLKSSTEEKNESE